MKVKNRLRKKYFKRVAVGLRTGQPLPRFYILKVAEEIERYFFIAYITGFRVWWYDQFDKGADLKMVDELNRWHDEEVIKFEQLAGFPLSEFEKVFQAAKKPRTSKPKPKQRKEKPKPPMHRIKPEDQRSYIINTKDGPMIVTGTRAFIYRDYEFFIFPDGENEDQWNISDFKAGRRVYLGYPGQGYRAAIERARERVIQYFDKYESTLRQEDLI